MAGHGLDSSGPWEGHVVGSCKHGNTGNLTRWRTVSFSNNSALYSEYGSVLATHNPSTVREAIRMVQTATQPYRPIQSGFDFLSLLHFLTMWPIDSNAVQSTPSLPAYVKCLFVYTVHYAFGLAIAILVHYLQHLMQLNSKWQNYASNRL
jgi:hypothetical protein